MCFSVGFNNEQMWQKHARNVNAFPFCLEALGIVLDLGTCRPDTPSCGGFSCPPDTKADHKMRNLVPGRAQEMSTPRTVSGYTSSNPEKDASKCFQGGIDDVYLIFPDVPLFYFGVAIVHTSIIWLLRLATYQPDYNHTKRPGWHLQMPSDTRLMYCQAPLGQDLQVPAAFWTEKQDSAPTVARCPLVF